ncbi:arginine deiminase family protein [Methanoculleus sp. 7T]|uniref:arginine deiminase family protein n=1 Tax=Methanoculleus sp. 7T TaxID=2937282 RepID=UPI0020C17166|nr:arginine deiminase family protein [Methanoculleus sp. 7T]MCK8518338.1 arginine deiminase family protein [Methanoculleus sp. 7T]
MAVRVRAEWERLRTVAVHRPGIEMFFGLLEPYAALYERAFSRYEARREHDRLGHTLREEFGVRVLRLKETILDAADRDPAVRRRLVDWAHETVTLRGGRNEVAEARRSMEQNADALDSQHFFTLLLLNPVIEVGRGHPRAGVDVRIMGQEPLANLYFMRDQQAVAGCGMVAARLAKPQRVRETEITGFLWDILGIPVAGRVEEPGTFEGGDFMPMGDFALVGTGDRTNPAGIRQFFASSPGFDEIGVVHQPGHPLIPSSRPDPMIDMHLDTYFNVAGSGVVIGSEVLLRRAQVDVYHRTNEGYEPSGEAASLYDYIRSKGFAVIDLSILEQLSYAANVLCVRDGSILTVEGERVMKTVLLNLERKAARDMARYGRLLRSAQQDYRRIRSEGQFFPHKAEFYRHDIEVYPLHLENLTGGYGGPHCMTCTLERG